jgi:hypothetical protein
MAATAREHPERRVNQPNLSFNRPCAIRVPLGLLIRHGRAECAEQIPT